MKCFVIMPFAESFDPVFEVVKDVAGTAVPDAKVDCYWLKDVQSAGRITDDILMGLNEATFCIADVSGHNPNVMWETGYAMALGKPTILIGRDIDALPFDLKSHRVLEYSSGDEAQLTAKLAEAVRQTLARYELKGSAPTESPSSQAAEQRTIAVTGSMVANEALACRRLGARPGAVPFGDNHVARRVGRDRRHRGGPLPRRTAPEGQRRRLRPLRLRTGASQARRAREAPLSRCLDGADPQRHGRLKPAGHPVLRQIGPRHLVVGWPQLRHQQHGPVLPEQGVATLLVLL